MIRVLTLPSPAWDEREILRYARVRGADEAATALMRDCITEAEPVLRYQVCYSIEEIRREGDSLTIGTITTASDTVHKALLGCERAILFAATVGTPYDRLIAKYSRLSPARALMLQAIGAERIESLCDSFEAYIREEWGLHLRTRISPGYGDFSLDFQHAFFTLLDCPRKIGLTLNESLLMSPSKSVTALAGITDDETACRTGSRCGDCKQLNCEYREQRHL